MSPLPAHVTEEYIYRAAPDGKVARAARALASAASWVRPIVSPEGDWLVAGYNGSWDRYDLWVDLIDPAGLQGECDCPSYKQPCKHVLGLTYLGLLEPQRLKQGRIPDEVKRAREDTYGPRPATPPQAARGKKEKSPKDVGESLLRDIHAHPEDEAPRLIYADWLQEHGGSDEAAYGEFIQVQCSLARMPADAPGRAELQSQEAKLWAAHRTAWLAHVPARLRRKDLVFHRGFLEELPITAANLARHGEEIFESYPTITRVRLTSALSVECVSRLVVLPYLSRLTSLALDEHPVEAGKKFFDVLLSSPYLANVTVLDLHKVVLGSRNVGLIVQNPFAAHLRVLDLRRNNLGEAGVKALLHSPHLDQLTALRLEDNHLTRAHEEALRERFGPVLSC